MQVGMGFCSLFVFFCVEAALLCFHGNWSLKLTFGTSLMIAHFDVGVGWWWGAEGEVGEGRGRGGGERQFHHYG